MPFHASGGRGVEKVRAVFEQSAQSFAGIEDRHRQLELRRVQGALERGHGEAGQREVPQRHVWKANMTWKSGLWVRVLSGLSSSTSFSKGRS